MLGNANGKVNGIFARLRAAGIRARQKLHIVQLPAIFCVIQAVAVECTAPSSIPVPGP